MSDLQTPRFVPLRIRRVVLRIIVISSLSSFLTGVIYGGLDAQDELGLGYVLLGFSIVPLSVFLHHILRLWPRKIWSARSDFIYSIMEHIAVTAYVIAEIAVPRVWRSPILMAGTVLFWLSLCASFAFTIWNHHVSQYRTMRYTYDFMENGALSVNRSNPQCGRWLLLLGENAFKRRFGKDGKFITGLRAVIAILCLLAMIALGYLVMVVQPITPQLYFQNSRITFVDVENENPGNVTLQVSLLFESGSPFGTSLDLTRGPESLSSQCDHIYSRAQIACTIPSPLSKNSPDDFTVTVNYTRALQDVSASSLRTGVYLDFDARPEDAPSILIGDRGDAPATQLYPGFHLFGTTFYSFQDSYTSSGDRFFGMPRFNRRLVGNIQALIQDPEYTPSNSDNATATLRLTYRGGSVVQTRYKIEREQSGNTVLSGFALLGGAWTFINGLFAIVFGCTLLLVLFGIKPLSIYGLVHLFQRRRSLTDGGYTLSVEDQTQTIALLRAHLLDSNSDLDSETNMAPEKDSGDGEQRGAGDAA